MPMRCSISVNPFELIFNFLDRDWYWKGRFKGQRWVACCMLQASVGNNNVQERFNMGSVSELRAGRAPASRA
ncbi:hypothetical protein EVAR_51466_1 [Eumeta japonica]|uniref:Uncharacterized protein n=1 Tax=Eumeta variegata TaxID=151549 RepID=A0A4C1Z5S9_EUMVA|nr:hypothetical protein EVAR_51466_1 [Eumeta japonica]